MFNVIQIPLFLLMYYASLLSVWREIEKSNKKTNEIRIISKFRDKLCLFFAYIDLRERRERERQRTNIMMIGWRERAGDNFSPIYLYLGIRILYFFVSLYFLSLSLIIINYYMSWFLSPSAVFIPYFLNNILFTFQSLKVVKYL